MHPSLNDSFFGGEDDNADSDDSDTGENEYYDRLGKVLSERMLPDVSKKEAERQYHQGMARHYYASHVYFCNEHLQAYSDPWHEKCSLVPEAQLPARADVIAQAVETETRINDLLKMAGVKNPKNTSKCVRAGLARGAFGFEFTGAPEQLAYFIPIPLPPCDCCGAKLRVRLRDVLKQPDRDPEDAPLFSIPDDRTAVSCSRCAKEEYGEGSSWYLTDCCIGAPRWVPAEEGRR